MGPNSDRRQLSYRCGKDAQQLLRLLQSEGHITHEFTTIGAGRSGTRTVKQVGNPVVLTTTTASEVYRDDETRFVSCPISTSRAQTLAIYQARAEGPRIRKTTDLPVWWAATFMLKYEKDDFEHNPPWLRYVAKKLPRDDVRGRRDWSRFLSFVSAVALCRGYRDGHPVDITFSDYCVAYRILEPVFAFTRRTSLTNERELAAAVAALAKRSGKSVTIRQIAKKLKWKEKVVYKRAKAAAKSGLIEYEKETRERNLKLIRVRGDLENGFLPNPVDVLRHNPQIGERVRYVDPFIRSVKTAWHNALKIAGLPRFPIYKCRATFATRLAAAGVSDIIVDQLLGHSRKGVLRFYTARVPEYLRDAIDLLDELRRVKAEASGKPKVEAVEVLRAPGESDGTSQNALKTNV